MLAVVTYGVKVPSGLFVPGIINGATFGRFIGEMVEHASAPGCLDVYQPLHQDCAINQECRGLME